MTLIFMFHSQEIFRIYQSSLAKLVNFHLASFVILFWMILWLHRLTLTPEFTIFESEVWRFLLLNTSLAPALII